MFDFVLIILVIPLELKQSLIFPRAITLNLLSFNESKILFAGGSKAYAFVSLVKQ